MTTVRPADVPWRWLRCVSYWDLAATKPSRTNRDPDWTAGVLLGLDARDGEGSWWLLRAARVRDVPGRVEAFIRAEYDAGCALLGAAPPLRVEQEGGASGKGWPDAMARSHRFVGLDLKARSPKGSKIERAKPVATAAQAGRFHVLEGPWLTDWCDELEAFPDGEHDDWVDATSGAFAFLRGGAGVVDLTPESLAKSDAWGAL